jgi:3-phenylpropionate/cinnamic acid dioxygenase small subunit
MAEPLSDAEFRTLRDFVFTEAKYADESRYDEWEALLTDDMLYRVPAGDGYDTSEFAPSIINDNRSRLATRLRQLRTGTRLSQAPLSVMRRLISNMTAKRAGPNEFEVEANFVVFEFQTQSTNQINTWPGQVTYRIRATPDGLRLCAKTVLLIHRSGPIPSMSFLI